MSVSLRVTGAWAELTADGSVAIPATPQAGDRMYLFARWKDFSVTATVADWTELVEFADGSTTSGNGSGSVKLGCWYRDWQSGDADPTIDFSAAPENASVVITVMAKGANDVWLTPVAVTAAMTNWTTTSQIVSASSTAVVKSDGVVIGLIGLRDDSATMTRPTTGIDDSIGAVTWNGNYVESPATHHSTTTGDDGAADLGYRLVTTGATATLRMTGTISAAETGAALWVVQGISVVVTPGIATLTSARFAPSLRIATILATVTLSITFFTPKLALQITPTTTTLSLTAFAPVINRVSIPDTASLTVQSFAPGIHEQVTPSTATLSLASFAAFLHEQTTPSVASLSFTSFAPSSVIVLTVIPDPASLTITTQSVSLNEGLSPATASLAISTFRPSILPFNIVYLDPGGDAVQEVGYFASIDGGGTATFDSSQQVVGVGSYKFDSGVGASIIATVPGVLGPSRRVSTYFRYDSVPDAMSLVSNFVGSSAIYSDGGFTDPDGGVLANDDEIYATATPAKNAGRGTAFGSFGFDSLPIGAIIDSVKIIYERKYDTDTSIGISRVKWRVNGEEGPDYDNTDQPLTDTVVTVDVSADRGWERQDLLDGVFEVIAEARRGDTDTEHTQSVDYLKVEVVYHTAPVIMAVMDVSNHTLFTVGLNPIGAGAVVRFTDGNGSSYDGITQLPVNTQNRIGFSYVLHAVDDLEIKFFVNGIQELSIVEASTGGFSGLANLLYGWVTHPGVDHLCWFDQLYIDDGDDLSDPGDMRMTAKLPASVNDDEWDTTTGTGAVNERPLSETNLRRHNAATSVRQTYTLEADDEGDIDISGETLVGYMGWAWAKMQSGGEQIFLVVNGVDINRTSKISAIPSLLHHSVSSISYPSNAAGIGILTSEEGIDTFLYECGVIGAYEGPDINPNRLRAYQLLAQDSVTNITDDLRADPPSTYDIAWRRDESAAQVTLEVYAITSEDQEPQLRTILSIGPGGGLVPIDNPGIEVSFVLRVTEADVMIGLYRFLNLT